MAGFLYLNVDVSDLLALDASLTPALEKAAKDASRDLSAMTHAHIVEQVQQKLHSSREKYLKHMRFNEVEPGVWLIELEPQAFFIEEGLKAGEMIEDLLGQGREDRTRPGGIAKGKVKTSKTGERYRVIPFQHNNGPTKNTPAQQSLSDTVKAEVAKRKKSGEIDFDFGGIEKGKDGKPKTGFLGGFDIKNKPLRTSLTGPGQGHGPLGAPIQGRTGIPVLQGIRAYQKEVTRTDKAGRQSTRTEKFLMSFRVVSTSQIGSGSWVHPGLEPRRFFDEAFDWCLSQWEHEIRPKLVAQVLSGL